MESRASPTPPAVVATAPAAGLHTGTRATRLAAEAALVARPAAVLTASYCHASVSRSSASVRSAPAQRVSARSNRSLAAR